MAVLKVELYDDNGEEDNNQVETTVQQSKSKELDAFLFRKNAKKLAPIGLFSNMLAILKILR